MKKVLFFILLIFWCGGVQYCSAGDVKPFSFTLFGIYGTPVQPSGLANYAADGLGLNFLAEWNPSSYFSLGLGYEVCTFYSVQNFSASTFNFETRIFPFSSKGPYSPYLFGGAGLNPSSGAGNWPGQAALKAGIGDRVSLIGPLAVDLGLTSHWMQDPGNFQYLDLRWGLTFAFGATDESKSQPTPTPKPQMSQTVTPTPAQTAVEPTMTETPTPTPIALEEKPIVKATVNSGPVTAIAAVKKYYRTGMKAFIAGHYQTALKLLTKSLAVKEAHMAYYYYAETYATIGVIYHFHSKVSNHKALAKKYYQKALKIDPTTKSAKKYLRMLTVKPTPTPSDTQAQ